MLISRAEKIYEDYNNFRAIIGYQGVVRWEPGGVFQTMCQIDITYYPFDEQVKYGVATFGRVFISAPDVYIKMDLPT